MIIGPPPKFYETWDNLQSAVTATIVASDGIAGPHTQLSASRLTCTRVAT